MVDPAAGRIFLSYRRQETQHPAGRLADRLVARFGPDQIFMDVVAIEPGVDFADAITRAVSTCKVLIAVIGPQWATLTDARGQPRIADPDDLVALEIQAALDRDIRVIPVLVDGASMPARHEQPEALQGLARRQARRLDHESFHADANRLLNSLENILNARPEQVTDLDPGHRDTAATTTTGPGPPPSPSQPDHPGEQAGEPEVEALYDRALAAFWTERWEQAVELLRQVLAHQPGHPNAPGKLEHARSQQQLATRYAQAGAAADAGDWAQALAGYTTVADADPDYRDTQARLEHARHQQQIAGLHTEARRLHRAGRGRPCFGWVSGWRRWTRPPPTPTG